MSEHFFSHLVALGKEAVPDSGDEVEGEGAAEDGEVPVGGEHAELDVLGLEVLGDAREEPCHEPPKGVQRHVRLCHVRHEQAPDAPVLARRPRTPQSRQHRRERRATGPLLAASEASLITERFLPGFSFRGGLPSSTPAFRTFPGQS